MQTKLFITTSNGVFTLDTGNNSITCALSNKHSRGIFHKKARGYFGICRLENGNILVSSREKLGFKTYNKPTTDTRLFTINPETLEYKLAATVRDVHDAHQIAYKDGKAYISDTGKNRVVVYDIHTQSLAKIINIGDLRDDVNHINALTLSDNKLLVGLNNRGAESEILSVGLNDIYSNNNYEIDALEIGETRKIEGVTHSHDLEHCRDMLLCCASKNGQVIDTDKATVLISADNWVRGLASDNVSLWVGSSAISQRSKRHKQSNHSNIYQYSLPEMKLTASYRLDGSGQINDMIIV